MIPVRRQQPKIGLVEVLGLVALNPGASEARLASLAGVGPSTMATYLQRLASDGLVIWRRWQNSKLYRVRRKYQRQGLFCSVTDCHHPARSRGFCVMHYKRWQQHGDPAVVLVVRQPGQRCSVSGCSAWVDSHGLCSTHYYRWRTHGDPLVVARRGRKPKAA